MDDVVPASAQTPGRVAELSGIERRLDQIEDAVRQLRRDVVVMVENAKREAQQCLPVI